MTQHALGCDGKPSDAPSHKYPGKMSRENQHSGDKVVYTGLSPSLVGVRESREGGEEAQKKMEVTRSTRKKSGERAKEEVLKVREIKNERKRKTDVFQRFSVSFKLSHPQL